MSKHNALLLGALALQLSLSGAAAIAEPIPIGSAKRTTTLKGEPLTVYTYRPACSGPSLLVVLHGSGRQASDYRKSAQPLADRHCQLVVAPQFDGGRFPPWRYHLGGLARGGKLQDAQRWT